MRRARTKAIPPVDASYGRSAAYGGGITSAEIVNRIIQLGGEKVVVNRAAGRDLPSSENGEQRLIRAGD